MSGIVVAFLPPEHVYWYACACGARDRDTRYRRDADEPLPCECGQMMARES